MVKVYSIGLMELIIKVNIKMMKDLAEELSYGTLKKDIEVVGHMEWDMDMANQYK